MGNRYIKVVDGAVVGAKTIPHGATTPHHSFALVSTEAEYNDAGYYTVLANKPAITKYQRLRHVGMSVDEPNKNVLLEWEIVDMSPEQRALVDETEAREAERDAGPLAKMTMDEAEQWIKTNLDLQNNTPAQVMQKIQQALIVLVRYAKAK